MQRKTFFAITALSLVLVCLTLSACIPIPDGGDKDKKLDSPIDIVFENITENAIGVSDVLYGEEGGSETEISINGTDWKDFDNSVGYVFDGLTPNTEYTVWARQKGYGEYKASDALAKKVTTLRSSYELIPEGVTAMIYHGQVTLAGVTDEMEVSFDEGKTYGADVTHTYTEKGEKSVLVRYKESANYLAGKSLVLKVVYNDFAGGSGTESDPYLIESFDELSAMNGVRATFKLNDDINYPETPVTEIIVFSGTLLGNGKKIIAPVLDYSANDDFNAYGGIFHTNGQDTVIRDLTVENAEITTNSAKTVHGLLINDTKVISNCKVSGKITVNCTTSRTYKVGGLCGELSTKDFEISNCRSNVTVELLASETSEVSGLTVGGLVGEISSVGSIKNSSAYFRLMDNGVNLYRSSAGGLIGYSVCYDKVSVSQSSAAVDINLTAIHCLTGGIAAMSKNIDIVNCYATGAITASGRNINPQSQCMSGGVAAGIGEIGGDQTGNILNCYSSVDIKLNSANSSAYAAGIIWNASGSSGKIENCLFAGSIDVGEGQNRIGKYAIAFNCATYLLQNNYILDDSALNNIEIENVTVLLKSGLTAEFYKDTLKFDETIWVLNNGWLPELAVLN